jgi:hypothetical protein
MSSAEQPKLYRTETIISGPGYRRMYGETTKRTLEASIFNPNPCNRVMAWRECGQSGRTVGFRLVGMHKNVPEADLLLIGLSSSAARGIVRHLSIQGLEMGTWEPHLARL